MGDGLIIEWADWLCVAHQLHRNVLLMGYNMKALHCLSCNISLFGGPRIWWKNEILDLGRSVVPAC